MKRLSIFIVLVLLALMVSSVVRASGDPTSGEPDSRVTVRVMDGDPNDPTPKARGVVSIMSGDVNDPVGTVRVMNGDPTDPDSKATPILM